MQYRILVIHKSILLSYKGELPCNTIHNLNEELKEMNELLKKLQEDFDTFNFDNQYYEINTEALDNKINGILEKIKEKLENE